MITEELKNKNYNVLKKKLSSIGVDVSKFDEMLGDKLINASFSISNENGCAYDGSLIHVVLRTLTLYAIKLNDMLPENLKVDQNSLVKVCLLSHISKCEMFVKNNNQWEVEKRGMVYTYAKSDIALKMGMKSLILSQNLGIAFTPEEIEAMVVMDRTADDKQSEFYSGKLSSVVKMANELTFLEIRNKKEN